MLCEKPLATSGEVIDEGRIGRVFRYRAAYLQEWGTGAARPPSWKGCEHTFIATLGAFLQAAGRGEPFHPDFDDGMLLKGCSKRLALSGQNRWCAVD